jgi:hypothetical protein
MAGGDSNFNNVSLVKDISGLYSSGNTGTAYVYFNNQDLHIRCNFNRTPSNGETGFQIMSGLQELITDMFGNILYTPVVTFNGTTGVNGSGFVFSPSDGVLQFISNTALSNSQTSFKFDLTCKPSWCNLMKYI